MRRVYLVVLFGFLILTSAMEAQGALDLSLQIGTAEATISFVYSDYYRVEPAVISRLENKKLSSDDVAVALFLSTRVKVSPEVIATWRIGGSSWANITVRLGLQPDIYFVSIPANVKVGPPYGRAYGYYWKKPKKFVLTDDEVVNLVQLRVVSEYYGYDPVVVMKWRESGERFDQIIVREHEKKHGKGGSASKAEMHEKGSKGQKGRKGQK